MEIGVTDIEIHTSLITFYGTINKPKQAEKIFNNIKDKDIRSCNNMLNAYMINKQESKAVKLFETNKLNNLIDNCTYPIMMNGFRMNDNSVKALDLFYEIKDDEKIELTPHVFNIALHCCADMVSLLKGEEIIQCLKQFPALQDDVNFHSVFMLSFKHIQTVLLK